MCLLSAPLPYQPFPPPPSNGEEGQQEEGGSEEAGKEGGEEVMVNCHFPAPSFTPLPLGTILTLRRYGGVF